MKNLSITMTDGEGPPLLLWDSQEWGGDLDPDKKGLCVEVAWEDEAGTHKRIIPLSHCHNPHQEDRRNSFGT